MPPSMQSSSSRVRQDVPAAEPATSLRLPETGFLRQRQVLSFVPISKSTLWRRVQSRTFPAPVKLSSHVTAWRVEDVRRWIDDQGRQAIA